MKVTYKRDPRESWLIVTPASGKAAAYPARMISENTLRGILSCRIARLDGEAQWYFDISGYRSLEDCLETGALSYAVLHALVIALLQTAEELEDYLLSPDGLLLAPEFCFLSLQEERFAFVYCPQENEAGTQQGPITENEAGMQQEAIVEKRAAGSFRENLRHLAQELLPQLDRTDSRAILFGYAFFRRVTGDELPAEALRGVLSEIGESMPERRPETRPAIPVKEAELEDEERDVLLDSLFLSEEEEEEGSWFARWREERRRRRAEREDTPRRWFGRRVEEESPRRWFRRRLEEDALPRRFGRHAVAEEPPRSWPDPFSDPPRLDPVPEVSSFRDEMTTLLASPDPATEEPAWRLVAVDSRTEPGEIVLHRERHLIGKEEAGADVHLSAKTVSRLHALLSREGEVYCIRDLHSKNTTTLNGAILTPKQILPLQEGDRICFANVEYLVRKTT